MNTLSYKHKYDKFLSHFDETDFYSNFFAKILRKNISYEIKKKFLLDLLLKVVLTIA